MTPAERSLRARIAAHHKHAQGKSDTSAARLAFLSKFDEFENPDSALKAHMATMQLAKLRKRAA